MLESLKDKARFEFNWEEGLREQNELDEWATVHHQPIRELVEK
jgi:flagellar biosynthesis chaperone FliJ